MYPERTRLRRRDSAPPRALTLGVLGALVAGTLGVVSAPAASAADADALNIGFAGSLVGTTDYTTAGDEIMRGTVRRADGGEAQDPDVGVSLAGGAQGILFDAAELSLGEQSMTEGVIMEAEFTPTADQGELATVLSAGGSLFVRYQAGQLRYGFDSVDGDEWTSHVETTRLPDADSAHQLSLQYQPTDEGAEMIVFLDGRELPPISADAPAALDGDLASRFGLGTEVHPAGSERGLAGSLRQIRVAPGLDELSPEGFELQPEDPGEGPDACEDRVLTQTAQVIPMESADCPETIRKAASLLRALRAAVGVAAGRPQRLRPLRDRRLLRPGVGWGRRGSGGVRPHATWMPRRGCASSPTPASAA